MSTTPPPATPDRRVSDAHAAPSGTIDLGIANHPDRQDRLTTVVLCASALVAVVTLVIVSLAIPVLRSTSDGVNAQNQSDEITACRSEYRAPIDQADAQVEMADAAVETADDLLERERTALTNVFVTGLVASITGDEVTLGRLVNEVPLTQGRVDVAQTFKDEAAEDKVDAADRKDRVAERYATAVTLSRTDQDAFLRNCRRLVR